MIPRRSAVALISLVFILLLRGPSYGQASAPSAQPEVIEHGTFILHKMEQPLGEESFETTRDGQILSTRVTFKFVDRGAAVPLSVNFRTSEDLTPQFFEIRGKTARPTDIDEAVEVQAEKIRVRNRDKWTDAALPKQFFTIAGYAPATMQMLMVRYWASHGSPAELETFPSSRIKIEARGRDTIAVNGKDETLDRYTIEGLIWGRE